MWKESDYIIKFYVACNYIGVDKIIIQCLMCFSLFSSSIVF